MGYSLVETRLKSGQIVILDGGVGTELERRGANMDPRAWCGAASLDHAALLTDIHCSFIAAGADIVTANTFASSRIMLEPAGLGGRVDEVNRIAVDAAHLARKACGSGDVAIAGSLSHAVPIAPGTDRADRSKLPSKAQLEDALTEQALIFRDAGCDLVALEMLYDPDRIGPVFKAAAASGLPVWAGFSARRLGDGRILSFDRDRDFAFNDILAPLDDGSVSLAGVMHTPSDVTGDALDILRKRFPGPFAAYPDSGVFKMPNWQFEDVISPKALAAFAQDWSRQKGVQVLGGCCGLGPDHIRALHALRDTI